MPDARNQIVKWAKWAVENRGRFVYTQDGRRMSCVHNPNAPTIYADCSAFVTYCYSWAGAPDPNGNGYNGYGYTGTLLAHGTPIGASQARPGDVVVYGPGTGWHTALIVEGGADPLTVSHGGQGDPNYCRVSQDGRQPQRFLRFDTRKIGAAPTPRPTPHQRAVIRQGSSGPDVAYLQSRLGIPADGIFGPQTAGAVRAFQQRHALVTDGIVGPATWGALG